MSRVRNCDEWPSPGDMPEWTCEICGRTRCEHLRAGDHASAWGSVAYLPPWREQLPDKTLGPEYGPTTAEAYGRCWREWEESVYGGGLWDPGEDAGRRRREERARVERYDAKLMGRFMAIHSARVPRRELEVFTACYAEGLSRARTAAKMGLALASAMSLLKQLRRRMRAWADGRQSSGCTAFGYPPVRS